MLAAPSSVAGGRSGCRVADTRAPPPSHVDTPVLWERTDWADEDIWRTSECSGDDNAADGTQDKENAPGPGVPLSASVGGRHPTK